MSKWLSLLLAITGLIAALIFAWQLDREARERDDGRTWTVHWITTTAFRAEASFARTRIPVGFGLFIGAVTWSYGTTRARAQGLAEPKFRAVRRWSISDLPPPDPVPAARRAVRRGSGG